jgi:cytochrome b6-f complex iron-sulfur subunit
MDRRKFLDTLLWTSLAGTALVPLAAVPFYLVPPAGALRGKRINLGRIPPGESRTGLAGTRAVIGVNEGGVRVFDAACTHDRCPVKWVAETKLFLCDCHGAQFDANGKVVKGPAKEPLAPLRHHEENGEVVVE